MDDIIKEEYGIIGLLPLQLLHYHLLPF